MSNPTPAALAILDQLDAAAHELNAYVNGLEPPDLLAELRCTTGRLIPALIAEHGPGHPFTITAVAIAQGISRFDLDGGVDEDGKVDDTAVPVPMAVRGSEKCQCDTEHGGIRGRIKTMHDLTHQLMHAQEGGR